MIWSPELGMRVDCPRDEITWLDRRLLSADTDPTLHRSPRCAGLRYLDHGWELFSHDTSHEVYLGPNASEAGYEKVRAAPMHVLPAARAGFQPNPLRLEGGTWLVSVGKWVVRLHVDGAREKGSGRADQGTVTQEHRGRARDASARGRRIRPLPGAVRSVRNYLDRKPAARMAIAYYYQEFILGAVGPQAVPMIEVAAALDLTGDAAVSEYKKELQRLIWNEQGHQRELAEFLVVNGLINKADTELANKIAAANERSGKTKAARARLLYRHKKRNEQKASR